MTTVSDMLFDLGGVPVRAPMVQGKHIFVNPLFGLDGNSGANFDAARKTLAAALSLVPANNSFKKGDNIYLVAQSGSAASTTDLLTATLTWDKDLTNLIGINASGSMLGQRSRICTASTAVGASITPLVNVTANACRFEDIEIICEAPASGAAAALGALWVSGNRNTFRRCQISGIAHSDLDVAGNHSLKLTGEENLFEDCYIGLDTIARNTATYEILMAAGAKRNLFRRCIIASYNTSNAAFTHVTASGLDRWTMFEDCSFINMPTGIASGLTMNQSFSISGTGGNIALRRCHFEGVTKIMTTGAATLQIDPKTTELLASVTI